MTLPAWLPNAQRIIIDGAEVAEIWLDGVQVFEPATQPGPVNTVAPAITGTAEVGQTLTRTLGTWTGTGTITYATQWLRNGTAISGATGATYLQQGADVGPLITVRVTATDDEGSRSAVSNAVAPEYPQPVAAGLLADVTVDQGSGDWTRAAAGDFTGIGLSYSLQAGPAGTSVNPSTGLVTGSSAALLSGASVVVRASTPDGKFADSGFSVTVAAVGGGIQVDGMAEGVGAQVFSVSDSEISFAGAVSVGSSGDTGARVPSMKITGAEGLTPTFRWVGRGATLAGNPNAGHTPQQLFLTTDPATNAGQVAANSISTDGDDSLITFPSPLPAGDIWVHSRTPAMFQWWQALIDGWIAHELTAPTESAIAFDGDPYVVGIAAGGRDHLDVRDLPAYAARAFKIGTGPLKVLANGGIHISETMGGSYVPAGMINWLLSDDADAVAARAVCTFYVYPCFNFHAAYMGGARSTGDLLIDSNRCWNNTPPSPSPQMRTLWQSAIEIDKGEIGFTATFDFHDYGTRTAATAYIQLWNYDGSQSLSVTNTIAGLSAKIQRAGARPTSNTDRFMAWMARNASAPTYAAVQLEGNIREAPAQWLELGQWLVKGLMVRVDAGDFDGNLPDDPQFENAIDGTLAAWTGPGPATNEIVDDFAEWNA